MQQPKQGWHGGGADWVSTGGAEVVRHGEVERRIGPCRRRIGGMAALERGLATGNHWW